MKKIIALLIRFVPRKYLQLVGGAGLKAVGALFYSGKSVSCPVCEHSYRIFLPYGRINTRPNALCPNCLSLERHRLIYLYLKEKTNFFNIESPLAKVKMDIHQIPFEENTFDVVLCNHVLEHVRDDIQAMREIHRVLKPGGFAILQVPLFPPMQPETYEDNTITDKRERERLFGQDDHVRKYGLDYTTRIERSGLKALEDEFVNELGESERKHYGLMKGEVLFLAHKN